METHTTMFWNHSKQHSSKTSRLFPRIQKSFGTIRNNTALKLISGLSQNLISFGTIRNNTALKLEVLTCQIIKRFGTIRNNTALKLIRGNPKTQ